MIEFTIQQQLEKDFERYMLKFYTKFKRFSFEDFGKFATTIINYNMQNHLIDQSQKNEYAYFLTTLFNKGMGNRISEEHLQLMAQAIAADTSVDFNVINELFA